MSYNDELQSNNDALRDILDEVNALPNGTGGVQPDYAQNDPAARDFIKNRPFYREQKWKCVAEPQTIEIVTNDYFVTGEFGFYAAMPHFLYDDYPDGTVFKIIVGNDEYFGTYKTGYTFIGNGALLSAGSESSVPPDTGEDFLVYYWGADGFSVVTRKPLTECEVSVYMLEGEEIKKIDPQFLPEPVQDDWNQNDSAAPDYIKNRPFYEEVIEGEVTITINPGDVIGASVADQIWAQRETAKYTVDGTNSGLQYWFDVSETEYSLYDGRTVVNVVRSSVDTLTFAISGETVTAGVTCNLRVTEVHKLDPKYLPDEAAARKPLILDANLSDYYGGHPEAGDEVLEAIKTSRQILVRVPNASGDNYVASYSPVYFTQLPLDGQYLYLFYLRDEKQDLSALLGQPAGTVVMPTYGQLMMLLSQHYDSNPLEG